MGVKTRGSPAPVEQELQKIAEDLRTKSAVQTIEDQLMALNEALDSKEAADKRALVFSRAGGLPTLVRLLRGNALCDSTPVPDTMFAMAGEALSRLLSSGPVMAELACAADLIPPLIDALHNAPDDLGCLGAANGLMLLARGKPEHRKAIAEGAVIAPVLELDEKFGGSPSIKGLVEPARELAWTLVRAGTVAVRDLGKAIRGKKTMTSFAALLILQTSAVGAGRDFVAALDEAGIVDALVTTLKHESPCCVAAAVGALNLVEKTPGGGHALVIANGALPALVGIMDRALPPGGSDRETSLYRRASFEIILDEKRELISYNNPTALATLAVAALCIPNLDRQPIVDGFLKAGGVPAVVRLLKKSTCPLTLGYAGRIIEAMMFCPVLPGRPNWSSEGAQLFYKAGLCQAILHVLEGRTNNIHEQVLRIMVPLLTHLPGRTKSAAIPMLVASGFAELLVGTIAKAGRDMVVPGVVLLRFVLRESEARRRLCMPTIVDQLSKWIAKWLSQVDGEELENLCILLPVMFHDCPCYIPAAIKANMTPGLVRALRKLRKRPVMEGPLLCLVRLTVENAKDVLKPGILPSLVQVLKDFIPFSSERTISPLLLLSGAVLLDGPTEGIGQWGPGLTREIAQLVTERAPAAAHGPAAEMLFKVGRAHPELIADWPKWGIEDSVDRLTMHSDPAIAVRATRLQVMLFCVREDPDLTARIIASQPMDPPAATTSPSPNRSQDRQNRATGPSQPTRPKASAAGDLSPQSHAEKSTGPGASPGRPAVGGVQACSLCRITAEVLGKGKLKECGGCRTVRYCGKECQNAHWPAHKATCKRLRAAR